MPRPKNKTELIEAATTNHKKLMGVGGSNIGSYFISTTSSHYDWAMKKMNAHKKNLGVK